MCSVCLLFLTVELVGHPLIVALMLMVVTVMVEEEATVVVMAEATAAVMAEVVMTDTLTVAIVTVTEVCLLLPLEIDPQFMIVATVVGMVGVTTEGMIEEVMTEVTIEITTVVLTEEATIEAMTEGMKGLDLHDVCTVFLLGTNTCRRI